MTSKHKLQETTIFHEKPLLMRLNVSIKSPVNMVVKTKALQLYKRG
jgi:hypothetical protein